MTKIKPILFSTPMVQAILNGSKTQTRRKNNHPYFSKEELLEHTLPAYEKGDILWVREAWRVIGWSDEYDEMLVEYKDNSAQWCPTYDPDDDCGWLCKYVENLEAKDYLEPNDKTERFEVVKELPWKPSIHMPKEAARVFLEVTGVRLERLQDISEEDAKAEGIRQVQCSISNRIGYLNPARTDNAVFETAKEAFQSLWESINGPGSWEANPFVWVYEFKQTEKPENF